MTLPSSRRRRWSCACVTLLVALAASTSHAQIYPDPDKPEKPAGPPPASKEALQAEREAREALQKRTEELARRLAAAERRARRDRRRVVRALARPPLAGFANGNFFVRSRDDWFRLSPSLRLQVDAYFFAPDFEKPGQPGATMFVRRARPEFFGHVFGGRVQFMLAGEFAQLLNGKPATDVFLIFNVHRHYARIQVGQFDLPFTLENRTSDRYIPFLERSFVVRNLGTANKEPGLMFFGGHPQRLFFYSLGIFNGAGINMRDFDNHFDVVGRLFVRPLATSTTLVNRIQLGGSFSWGERALNNSAYLGGAVPEGGGWLNTPSEYNFFRTVYSGADGKGTKLGVVPEGTVVRGAVELNVPVGRFVARSEYIYQRSEVNENVLALGAPLRLGGSLQAHGVYGQLSFWPVGNPDILPDPGVQGAPLFDASGDAPESDFHLELVARFDYVWARYVAGADAAPHSYGASQVAGTYKVWDLALGVNLWWTRHVRLSINYVYHHIDGGLAAQIPSSDQNFIQELSARAALAL